MRTHLSSILLLCFVLWGTTGTTAPFKCADIFAQEQVVESVEVREDLAKIDKVANDYTIAVADSFALKKEDAVARLSLWLTQLKTSQDANEMPTVIEHSSLIYILKSGFLEAMGHHEMQEALKARLSTSWLMLTGKVPKNLGSPLPWRLLIGESRETRLFYSAALRGQPARGQMSSIGDLLRNYLPRQADANFVATGGLLLAYAFSHSGGNYVAAPILGATLASIAEYVGHRFVGHAKGVKVRETPKSWFQTMVKATFIQHGVIHHGRTFKTDYNQQFDSPEQLAEVDRFIDEHLGPAEVEEAHRTNYGLTLTQVSMAKGVLTLLPVHLAISQILHLDPIATAEMIATSVFYTGGIRYIHPYMHMSQEQMMKATEGKPLLRWYLNSRYASLVAGVHVGHHRDQQTNFSFAVLAGDILFGTIRLPTMADYASVRHLNIVGLANDP